MISLIFILIIVLIAVFIVVVSMLPSDFRYERYMTMSASPDDIYAQINDLHKWNAWSPWAKIDPNSKVTFTGPNDGIGSAMRWESDNNKVGIGTMTIVESKPGELVRLRLDFEKPMVSTMMADFILEAEDSKTKLTWAGYGKANFIGKAMGLLMNCEKMIGDLYNQGLANIKAIVETKPQ